jgi:hypothetical protein
MPAVLPGGAWWPERRTWALGHPVANALNPYNLGVPTKRCGVVVQAPHTGTLAGFGVVLGTANDVGGTSTYSFALQGVDPATGRPDGTGLVSVGLTRPAWPAHTWFRAEPMSGTLAVTRGDFVACTMEFVVEGTSASAFWLAVQSPTTLQGPPWPVFWTAAGGWAIGASSTAYLACLELIYTDADLDGPPEGPLPLASAARFAAPHLVTSDPIAMDFTVPRSLRCDAVSFHLQPVNGATLALTEDGILIAAGEIAASSTWSDWEVAFPEVTLRPGRAYRAALTPLTGTLTVEGYKTVPDMVTHFEGGPTWVADGDDPAVTDRWFFSLRVPGVAAELEPPAAAAQAALPRCVVIPVCPEAEEPGPVVAAPTVFAAWSPGQGPLQRRARRRVHA